MAFTGAEEQPTVVTRAGLGIGTPNSDESLIEDLQRGLSVGEAVARYNSTIEARALDRRYLILGNPNVYAAAPSSPRSHSPADAAVLGSALLPTVKLPCRTARRPLRRRFAWLANLALRGLETSAAARIEPEQRRALYTVATAFARMARAETHRSPERTGRALLTLIPLLGRHALTDLWEDKAEIRLVGRGDCHDCRGEESRFFCRIAEGEDRTITICQSCGITQDRPAASPSLPLLHITADGRLGPLPEARAASRALSLYAYDQEPSRIVTSMGRSRFCLLPPPRAEGPVQIGLWEYAAGTLAVRYRRVYVRLSGDEVVGWLRPRDSYSGGDGRLALRG